jgi:hypothetical protein
MRALSMIETEQAAGGFSVFGITEIETGLSLMSQVRSVTGNIGWSFAAGYAIGTGIYYGYEWITGDSLGGDLYDAYEWFVC